MQEALKASALADEIDCTTSNGSFRDDEALTNNQLQTAVLRDAAVALTDAEQARKLQQDMQQLASLEAHDLRVARWLDEATQDEWDNCGDHMEQPGNIAELRQNKMKGFLTFGGHVQGCNAGHAALLRAESGKQIWQGAKSEAGTTPIHKVVAQLQGLHMGLLAAYQLGFQSVVVQAPNSSQLLQALDDDCVCSSQLAAYADAVHEIMDLFGSARVELGDSEETWAIYKAAAHACKQSLRGEGVRSRCGAKSIGYADS